jgi:hypothetical protein
MLIEARPPIIHHADQQQLDSWGFPGPAKQVKAPKNRQDVIKAKHANQGALIEHGSINPFNPDQHQIIGNFDAEESSRIHNQENNTQSIKQPDRVESKAMTTIRARLNEQKLIQQEASKITHIQQSVDNQQQWLFAPLGIKVFSWESLVSLEPNTIDREVARNLVVGGSDEVADSLSFGVQALEKTDRQTLKQLGKLDSQTLRKLGFDSLATEFKQHGRHRAEARHYSNNLMTAIEDGEDPQAIISEITKKAQQSESNRWPLVLAGIGVALLAGAAGSKDKRIKQACLVAFLALNSTGILSACGPESTPDNTASPTTVSQEESGPTQVIEPLPESTPSVIMPLTPAPTETAIPLIEPTSPPPQSADQLPVNPPNFNEPQPQDHGKFDLIDAHAVYELYRQQEGPSMWTTDEQFILEMEAYLKQLSGQGIELLQATKNGVTYSQLAKGNHVLMDFNADDGALRDITPGRWSAESIPQWVDIGARPGLYIGDDDLPYIAKLDANGNVIAFLKPIGANEKNITSPEQWINVINGYPDSIWNGKEWTKEIPIEVIVGDFSFQEGLDTGYEFMTKEQVAAYPTTFTIADLHNPNLGATALVYLGRGDGEWWVGAKVAASKRGGYIGVDGATNQLVEVVVDIPNAHRTSLTRYHKVIQQVLYDKNVLNLDAVESGINAMVEKGRDPKKGITLEDIQRHAGDQKVKFDPNGVRRPSFENFANRQLVGSYMGLLISPTAQKLIPGMNMLGEKSPNQFIKIIVDSDAKPDDLKNLDDYFYEVVLYGIPASLD